MHCALYVFYEANRDDYYKYDEQFYIMKRKFVTFDLQLLQLIACMYKPLYEN